MGCGPKLSLCGVVLSAWGIVQLSLMGVFFYINSVALIEDIPLPKEEYDNIKDLRRDIDMGYVQNAQNCWIAALLYLVTLCFSAQQFWMNNKSTQCLRTDLVIKKKPSVSMIVTYIDPLLVGCLKLLNILLLDR